MTRPTLRVEPVQVSTQQPNIFITPDITMTPPSSVSMDISNSHSGLYPGYELVTPPSTPVKHGQPTNLSACDWSALARRTALFTPPLTLPPHTHVEITSPPPILGAGAWSTVMAARLAPSGLPVAIKQPSRAPGATAVLQTEAKVLSYLTTHTAPHPSIARYIGWDAPSSSLLLEHVPGQTLSSFARAQRPASIREPVMGLRSWLNFAQQLTDAMAYLKKAGVVHGDVTWHNVLVLPDAQRCTLIDFSSAHLEIPGARPPPISAVTTGFCAPELLEAFVRRPSASPPPAQNLSPPPSPGIGPVDDGKPHPVPTFASDFYGLCMTLLAAAVGMEVYEGAGRHVAIYAKSGQPLQWLSAGDSILRVGRKTVVGRLLNGCFGKEAEKRIAVEDLQARIRDAIAAL